MYEIHTAEDKINYYTSKYKMDFDSFERRVTQSSKENFKEWDDYLEWKGYQTRLKYLTSKRKDLENVDIKAA